MVETDPIAAAGDAIGREVARLQAENARLRGALDKIARSDGNGRWSPTSDGHSFCIETAIGALASQ